MNIATFVKSAHLVLPSLLVAGMCGGNFAWAGGVARLDLGGAWQVTREGTSETFPAVVPGCIHTDLLAAKKIPDPFYRDNEKVVQWVSDANWLYRRSFDVAPELLAHDHVMLKCEGLDTLATIRINGTQVARTDNMFRTYEFDVKKLLKPGDNSIEIRFESVLPLLRAKESQRKLPTWAYPGAGYVRKEPCNFGWDWGPTLITCGIWRNIGIEAFNVARLDDVAILQDHSEKGQGHAQDRSGSPPGRGESFRRESRSSWAKRQVAAACRSEARQGEPRWPSKTRSFGGRRAWAASLCIVSRSTSCASGKRFGRTTRRIGLRTLRAVPQTAAMPLHFEVNGVPFFAKGANWIPADCFANRLTKDVLRRYVDDAVAANMNTLRFWGGGYYEDDALFDLCDERGICIWLDFKFGCSTYPAFDEAFLKNVAAEARDNIAPLAEPPLDRGVVRQQRDHVLPRRQRLDRRQNERERLLQALPRHPGRGGPSRSRPKPIT